MSGKSKLSSFIAKGKKKIASKAPVADATAPVILEKNTAEVAPAVTLDVVQTKVLEQWGGAEDDELAEETGEATIEPRGMADDEDDDEEIDLPSSQARGKYEWKKKQDELTAEEQAKKEADEQEAKRKKEEEERKKNEGLLLRRKRPDITDASSFPILGPPSLPSSTEAVFADGKKRRKAKSTSSKARELRDPSTAASAAEKSAERQLVAEDIWAVVGKWSAQSWPKVILDETAVRNRFDNSLLKTID
eukprot:Gregarina_sp_Poly_1__5217@NODE_2766_length_1746_cov_176_819535_g1745_i0_p2_GENE_NODE_2766_length_1746_cov_176_819535_g1745_i0NODE_2766_length_1746_cov_176_819535_g1745_i0_p2_ORF_typecomplete_len248_score73_22TFIIF_alpha/PF05793_12/0_00027SDA1/PF05285_12/0_0038Borrelia_P83/PF05262_11/0_26rRNA_processing/PF08524_11/0_15rRNA_processing/PF08524_11/1_9e02DUF2681/PF10883_8/3_3NAMassociated/PF14303_6/0_85NAMassociated/PF14303_6/2_5e02_NODE_2766_length_1746_cov_176_819535_g1745_i0102845